MTFFGLFYWVIAFCIAYGIVSDFCTDEESATFGGLVAWVFGLVCVICWNWLYS